MRNVREYPTLGKQQQKKFKMLLPLVLVGFSLLMQASLLSSLFRTKPKPVDLEYSCKEVLDPETKNFKHDDIPVILIHGMGENKETWYGIYETIAFGTKKKVCAVDLRNHGQSPWNDEEYDVIAMTEDIKHLIEKMKAPKAIVIGHSLGAKTTVNLALNYPEKVEKVIVEDMRPNGLTPEAVKGTKDYAGVLIEMEKLLPQGVTEGEAKEHIFTLLKEYALKLNFTFNPDDVTVVPFKFINGECKLSINPVLLDAAMRDINEVLKESSGRFDGPALFINGAESQFKVAEDESSIKKLFPKAELVEVEGADHMVHSHEKFTREVIKFINSK